MRIFLKKSSLVLFLMALCNGLFAQVVNFSTQVSSNKIGKDEQLQVTFTVSNIQSAVNFSGPAFRDFNVLSGPHQSNSTNISEINGRREYNQTVSFTYVLSPKRTGNLSIEPASVITQGSKLVSRAIGVEVTNERTGASQRNAQRQPQYNDPFADFDEFDKMMEEAMRRQQQMLQQMQQMAEQAQSGFSNRDLENMSEAKLNENVFIRAEVDNKNPFVGQQINVTYKLYTRLSMNAQMTGMPSLNGFWAQDYKLPPGNVPVQEMYNGKPYNVFTLKKTALFPQKSGRLMMEAAKAEGVVVVFDRVPSQWGDQYAGRKLDVKLSSMPVAIDVKPLPDVGKPSSFTGAVGQFSIKAVLDKNEATTDDIVQLILRIEGSGNLKLINAPTLELPQGLSVMEPEISDSVMSLMPKLNGYKQFVYSISPDVAGNYTIPPIAFSYYDPSSGQYKTLQTPSFPLNVKQGTKAKSLTSLDGSGMKDIHELMKNTPAFHSAQKPVTEKWYYWLMYLLPALAFAVFVLLQKRGAHIAENQALFKNKRANKVAWKRLATARKAMAGANHVVFYEEVSKAIWLYLSDKLALPISALSKENVAQELRFKGVKESLIDQTKDLITECEMALYSPSGGQMQKQHTLQQATALIGDFENEFKKK